MDYLSESLKLHYKLRGKLEIKPRAGVGNKDELVTLWGEVASAVGQ